MPRRSGTITVMVARQIRGHRRPHVAGLAIAVQQHHRRPRAADADMVVLRGLDLRVRNPAGNAGIASMFVFIPKLCRVGSSRQPRR